ncbi:MAG: helix-turn-helix domain-containing protein [Acidimicrobiales bacterium]
MNAARTIRQARQAAGLSKRELARRAGTSPAADVAYETGRRETTVATLDRLLAAAGARAELTLAPARPTADPREAARRLAEVLALAEHLPRRPAARQLAYPVLPR